MKAFAAFRYHVKTDNLFSFYCHFYVFLISVIARRLFSASENCRRSNPPATKCTRCSQGIACLPIGRLHPRTPIRPFVTNDASHLYCVTRLTSSPIPSIEI